MKSIEHKISYTFKNKDLLNLALTHKSYDKNNNERLEFLGDAILSSIITDSIFKTFNDENEGGLSRIRSYMINKEKLVEIATRISLPPHIKISKYEANKKHNHSSDSILADTVEALIGAIYIDSDWNTCCNVVTKWYQQELQDSSISKSDKDPKTKLQEYLQALSVKTPNYKVIETLGKEHKQTFVVSCKIENIEETTKGQGRTIKKAEQDAAEKFLKILTTKEIL